MRVIAIWYVDQTGRVSYIQRDEKDLAEDEEFYTFKDDTMKIPKKDVIKRERTERFQ